MNSRKYRVAGTGNPAQPTVIIVAHRITLWRRRCRSGGTIARKRRSEISHPIVGRVGLAHHPPRQPLTEPARRSARRIVEAERFSARVGLGLHDIDRPQITGIALL